MKGSNGLKTPAVKVLKNLTVCRAKCNFLFFFTVNRQKVSSHLNFAYFSILADRHGLLTPEESRSKLPNSFHVLKKIPFRHHKTQLELA